MTTKEKEAQALILKEIEKANQLMITHLEKFCADTNATAVPMIYIKESYKILMNGYKSGANDTNTTNKQSPKAE